MIVVSDTTAISNLVQIGDLDLLQSLYKEVVIPESVYQELQVLIEQNFVSAQELQRDWIIVKQVEHQENVNGLLKDLDQGESEAIVLGIELSADFLSIDEKTGRLIAAEKQIKTIGTLGVLLESKRKGLIDSVAHKMDHLREIGFWISDSLYAKIIELEKQV